MNLSLQILEKKSRWHVDVAILLSILMQGLVASSVCAETPTETRLQQQSLAEQLDPAVYKAPKVHPYSELDQSNIQAIFFEGIEYRGKPTRVFAYLGIPKSENPVPAMVLVHGGGGTAFHDWVKIWNDRGYAAIAMSLEGHMPDSPDGSGKQTHEHSGPARVGMFSDIEEPLEDQWMYHAVSDCILAHSLMASLPDVDSERIGISGISWGGILSSLVSGVDSRLKCAIPVYGCGFLYESKGHFNKLRLDGTEINERKKFWDPSNQFVNGSVPTLWVNGDSDAHFSINCTSHSFAATREHALLCVRPSMPHGHHAGWDPEKTPEIYAFANQMLKHHKPELPRITRQPSGRNLDIAFESDVPVIEATVYYLDEPLTYRATQVGSADVRPGPWLSMPVQVNNAKRTVTATLPDTCQTYYVNLKTERGHVCSSMLVETE